MTVRYAPGISNYSVYEKNFTFEIQMSYNVL